LSTTTLISRQPRLTAAKRNGATAEIIRQREETVRATEQKLTEAQDSLEQATRAWRSCNKDGLQRLCREVIGFIADIAGPWVNPPPGEQRRWPAGGHIRVTQ
jgi:hypothetical protein